MRFKFIDIITGSYLKELHIVNVFVHGNSSLLNIFTESSFGKK